MCLLGFSEKDPGAGSARDSKEGRAASGRSLGAERSLGRGVLGADSTGRFCVNLGLRRAGTAWGGASGGAGSLRGGGRRAAPLP